MDDTTASTSNTDIWLGKRSNSCDLGDLGFWWDIVHVAYVGVLWHVRGKLTDTHSVKERESIAQCSVCTGYL